MQVIGLKNNIDKYRLIDLQSNNTSVKHYNYEEKFHK